jgi:hypothetical protein
MAPYKHARQYSLHSHSKQGASRAHETYNASAAVHKRKLVVNETNTSEIANAAFQAGRVTCGNGHILEDNCLLPIILRVALRASGSGAHPLSCVLLQSHDRP